MQEIKGKRIHFVGINGSGMSALMMLTEKLGAVVSGSDAVDGEYFSILKGNGFDVYVGINQDKAKESDVVVYSLAIPKSHPELQFGNTSVRGEFLGCISRFFENTVAIAGTHGKTTTTAMIAHVLNCLNIEFSYLFGGIDKENNTNFGYFGKKMLLVEACEYKNSFLYLNPTYSAITNIEYDHPDFYTSFDKLLTSFSSFAKNTKRCIVLGKNVKNALDLTNVHVNTYAFDKDFQILQGANDSDCFLLENGEKVPFDIGLDGFNLYNAAISYAVIRQLGFASGDIIEHLKTFGGVKRRQEYIGNFSKIRCFSDYAHHPTQIKKLIEYFSRFGKVIAVFEPHTYSRTKQLLNDFAIAFSQASKVVLLPVYAAREDCILGGDSATLFEKIDKKDKFLASDYLDATGILQQIVKELNGNTIRDINKKYIDELENGKVNKSGFLILFIGAGSIDGWARSIVESKN